jgi:hypothetical protein
MRRNVPSSLHSESLGSHESGGTISSNYRSENYIQQVPSVKKVVKSFSSIAAERSDYKEVMAYADAFHPNTQSRDIDAAFQVLVDHVVRTGSLEKIEETLQAFKGRIKNPPIKYRKALDTCVREFPNRCKATYFATRPETPKFHVCPSESVNSAAKEPPVVSPYSRVYANKCRWNRHDQKIRARMDEVKRTANKEKKRIKRMSAMQNVDVSVTTEA